jgi:hypothetical protein
MNQAQRIVLILYCLLLAYCCLWIPWHVRHRLTDRRTGYGWLWTGPKVERVETPSSPGTANLSDIDEGATARMSRPQPKPTTNYYYDSESTPDLPLILLRLVVGTAVGAAAFLLSGMLWKSGAH